MLLENVSWYVCSSHLHCRTAHSFTRSQISKYPSHNWPCSGNAGTSWRFSNKTWRCASRANPNCTFISCKTALPFPSAIKWHNICSIAKCSARNFARINGTWVTFYRIRKMQEAMWVRDLHSSDGETYSALHVLQTSSQNVTPLR